jgi:hypothetical protein
MKFQSTLSILAICAVFVFSSCGSDADAPSKLAGEGEALQPGAAPAVSTDAPKAEPPQNAEGVWHYTCTKGCAGGAGAATACATCGGTLVHNQVYHGKAAPASSANPAGGLDQALGAPGATLASPSAGKNEPPQNAAGVWHYICEAGCAGGGGAAGNCAKCQKPLLHNKAYH